MKPAGDIGSCQPAVTGMGAVSAVGVGCLSLRLALDEGRDGMAPITRFSTAELAVHLGGMVPVGSEDPAAQITPRSLCIGFALQAAREAWMQAHVQDAGMAPDRIAMVLGTSIGGHVDGLHGITEEVGVRLGVGGPRLTVSTACSSSANALDLARHLLQSGQADLVVAGGADVLTPEVFAGFHALGLLSHQKCAPFSEPYGTTLGEGAGMLILESEAQAQRRGIRPRAFLNGFGLSADAHHATTPDPTGAGLARALRAALEDAGLSPDEIGYVNAHGTGTQANDIAEWRAVRAVFGARAENLPVSATKSILGHAQGAAGVLEIIATILCMERGLIPPTLHHVRPRPFSPPDAVAGTGPRRFDYDHAACNSSAFGGANAVVIAGRGARSMPARTRRPVYLLGTGWVASAGVGSGGFRAAPGGSGLIPDFNIQALVPTLDHVS
jgi:3-oxoacyl-[acyl-carrier-protein] synthase II